MNLERHTVNMRFGMLLEIATVLGAVLGGITANLLSGAVLKKLFAFLLLIVSVLMIRRARQRRAAEEVHLDGTLPGSFVDDATGTEVKYTVKRIPSVMSVAFVAGNVSGLLGVGGGIFKVPAMTMLSGMPIKAATATSNFMIGVTAAASAFIYFANGHMDPYIASPAVLGVLTGSIVGVRLGRKIKSHVLTWIFALVLLAIAIQLYVR